MGPAIKRLLHQARISSHHTPHHRHIGSTLISRSHPPPDVWAERCIDHTAAVSDETHGQAMQAQVECDLFKSTPRDESGNGVDVGMKPSIAARAMRLRWPRKCLP